MTTISETRVSSGGVPYQVHTPVNRATDTAFDKWFVGQLREFLHRRGCRVDHIPDETLLAQTRNTFQTTTLRNGITSAKPIESTV